MIVGTQVGQEQFICQEYRQVPYGSQRIRQRIHQLGYQEMIPGGSASGLSPSDFNRRQLSVGTKVEMEHTTSRKIAREIAMDHLQEDPDYYRKLAAIHLDGYHLGADEEPNVFEKLIEDRAAIGAKRAVTPMVTGSIIIGSLGFLLGAAALVVAIRR